MTSTPAAPLLTSGVAGAAAVLAILGPTPAAVVVVGVIAASAAAVARRWDPVLPLSRAVIGAAFAVALIVTQDAVDEAWLAVLPAVVRLGARSPARVRAAMAADTITLALLATGGRVAAPELLVVWVGAALWSNALVALEPGTRRAPSRRVVAGLLLVLAVAPVAALALPPPDSGRGVDWGDLPSRDDASGPYLQRSESLDAGDRPDRGDLDALVLTVQAREPSFWRGQTFDVFDGRRWSSSSSLRPVPVYRDLPTPIDDPTVPVERLVQRFRVEGAFLQQLVAAPVPSSVDAPVGVVQHRDGSLESMPGLGRGATYTVESVRPAATADLLRARDPRTTVEPLPPEAEDALQVPDDVDPRVRELARTVDAGAASTYDLVRAVEDWLDDNTEYTLELPPLPDDADVVAQHLFVDRRGWCEQIATSAAVLLRLAGVPARLATGFAPGDRAPVGDEFRVRVGDAHAWVEVWFPGVGWQGFDPTADVPLAGEVSSRWQDVVLRVLEALLPWLGGAAAIALVGFATWRLVELVRARGRRSWPVVAAARLDRAGRRRGRPRWPAETVLEHARALVGGPLPDPRLLGVAALVTDVAYGGADPDPAARAGALQAIADAERAHPRPRWWRRVLRRDQQPRSGGTATG